MSEPLTILVVEDDHVYAEFIADALRDAGHAVIVVATGAAARERAQQLRPDAVVLDLALPDENGYELARALRQELSPLSSIILLTATLFPERDRAEAVGIDIVLTKPVEADLVRGMIDLIRDRRSRRVRSD